MQSGRGVRVRGASRENLICHMFKGEHARLIAINREEVHLQSEIKRIIRYQPDASFAFYIVPLQEKNALYISFTTIINGSTSHRIVSLQQPSLHAKLR
jgi:hypothetical protein